MNVKHKRRWRPRFTMRALLIVIALLCVWLAHYVRRIQRHRTAVAMIERLDGSYHCARSHSHWPRWTQKLIGDNYCDHLSFVDLSASDADDNILELMKDQRVRYLGLQLTDISSGGLRHLRSRTGLRNLLLSYTRIDDKGLAHLARMANLRSLNLAQTKVRGPGLRYFRNHPVIEEVNLAFNRCADSAIEHVSTIPNLRRLYVVDANLSDQSIAHLTKCEVLTQLTLIDASITDDALRHIASIKILHGLHLDGNHITDEGLRHLRHADNLRTLSITNTHVTDEGLRILKDLQLTWIRVAGTGVTKQGAAELTKAMPTLRGTSAGIDLTTDSRQATYRTHADLWPKKIFVANDPNSPDSTTELLGVWEIVEVVDCGIRNTRLHRRHRIAITDADGLSKWQHVIDRCGSAVVHQFEINPAAASREIDIRSNDGTVQLGIYELTKEQLTICTTFEPPGKRPPNMETDEVMNIARRMRLRRVRK